MTATELVEKQTHAVMWAVCPSLAVRFLRSDRFLSGSLQYLLICFWLFVVCDRPNVEVLQVCESTWHFMHTVCASAYRFTDRLWLAAENKEAVFIVRNDSALLATRGLRSRLGEVISGVGNDSVRSLTSSKFQRPAGSLICDRLKQV